MEMTDVNIYGISIMLVSVLLASIAQILLKKEALVLHTSTLQEYINIRVTFAYVLLLCTTIFSVYALKFIDLSMCVILESASYFYATIFGKIFFNETIGIRNWCSLGIILLGIVVFCL